MAADSPAEKMLIKLLLQNKLITKSQLKRTIDKSVKSEVEQTLPDVLLEKEFVDPKVINKILPVIQKKKVQFPLLSTYSEKSDS